MRQIVVNVSDELFELAGGDETQTGNLMTQAVVAELIRRKVISSGKASELLGISRWDMPELLSRFEISATEFRPEEDLKPF
jgi:predicted HTH domain antitoxin